MVQAVKLDILAIAAHPDDVELSCAGTLLKHVDSGYKVGILDLTKGELGTRGSASLRMEESARSAEILKLSYRRNLGMRDGLVEYNETNLNAIIAQIRETRPRVAFLNAPHDRHPDHGNGSKLARDACFYAGLAKWKIPGHDVSPWRPEAIYYYIQDVTLKPDFLIDVTAYVDQKFESIMAFRSQFFENKMEGPQTPISGKDFQDYLKARMRTWGRPINVEFAEGFLVERMPGIETIFSLK